MSVKNWIGRALGALVVLALLLGVVAVTAWAGAAYRTGRADILAPPPTETAAPTPHVHSYDRLSGLCTDCGEACPHDAGWDETLRCRVCGMLCRHERGFTAESLCLDCGWACPHERHDGESACCLVCGKQLWHAFGMQGRCEGCGRGAPITTGRVPEGYLEPAEHQGECRKETISAAGREHTIAVWLPYGYDGTVPCNVAIMIHGDGGSCDDWTDREEWTKEGMVRFCTVYDHLMEEHLCAPFLVVGVNNDGMGRDPAYGERLIEEVVLPHIARSYATYMEGDSHDEICAARDHIAIGGLSRGSIYTYYIGMPRCLDVAANFCCFSNSYLAGQEKELEGEKLRQLEIRSYIATIGAKDVREYNEEHRAAYEILCRDVERIRDGENARFLELEDGHDFLTWTAAFYDALLLMF